jgi:hypothetical protein
LDYTDDDNYDHRYNCQRHRFIQIAEPVILYRTAIGNI